MKDYVKRILKGDVRAAARLMRDLDDDIPEAYETLKKLYPHTGRAHIIGITGAPGVGKSTLVDQLITRMRAKNKTIGVIAVDPTSPFSGGALLGDRIRMQRHSTDDGVFIRSMATRGQFGGLTKSTAAVTDVMDAMGKDYIILETVGVGQDEVDIVHAAHSTVVLVAPSMGDEVQTIKAGILEIAHIFVVNKADKEGAHKAAAELKMLVEMDRERRPEGAWEPPILLTEADKGKGVDEVMNTLERHWEYLQKDGARILRERQKERIRKELEDLLKTKLMNRIVEIIQKKEGSINELLEKMVNKETDPYTAAEKLVANIK